MVVSRAQKYNSLGWHVFLGSPQTNYWFSVDWRLWWNSVSFLLTGQKVNYLRKKDARRASRSALEIYYSLVILKIQGFREDYNFFYLNVRKYLQGVKWYIFDCLIYLLIVLSSLYIFSVSDTGGSAEKSRVIPTTLSYGDLSELRPLN